MGQSHAARATAGLLVSATAPAVFLGVLTGPTLAAARAPGADPSALLSAVALLAAWVLVVRLCVVAVLVVGCRLPGAVGAVAARVAVRLSPRLLRSAARVAVGLAVAAGPVGGPAAAFASAPDRTAVAAAAALPTLDRGFSAAAIPAGERGHRPPRGADAVVVRPGDSLWTIAARHLPRGHTCAEIAAAWPAWYEANRAVIGDDPGSIRPGQVLVVPTR